MRIGYGSVKTGLVWGLFVFTTTNLIWGYAGQSSKILAVLLSCSLLLARILLVSLKRYRIPARVRLGIAFVAISLLPTAVMGITKGVFSAYKISLDSRQFEYRVDYFMRRCENLYRSTYMPEWLYASIKKSIGMPFHPEYIDYSHRFSTIEISCYALNNLGVIEYIYTGDSYGGMQSCNTYHFISQSEEKIVDHGGRIEICDMSGSKKYRTTYDSLKLGDMFACVGFTALPDTFQFKRSFCSPGAMKESEDGFLFDFRNCPHMPKEITVTLVSNHALKTVESFSFVRELSFERWITGEPRYKIVKLGDADIEIDENVIRNIVDKIEAPPYRLSLNGNGVSVYKVVLKPSGDDDVFALRYSSY